MEAKRDAGLKRLVGTRSLAASIVCIVIGAGIFAVPGALAASIGPYAPLAILVCAIAIGSIGICFAEAGSRIASSGGAYGCIHAAFGPLTGYIAGMLLWVGNALASGGVAAALADVATDLLPPSLKAPMHTLVIMTVVGFIAFVNIGGIGRAARLVSWATVLKLAPLVIFVVFGAAAVHAVNYVPSEAVHGAGIGRALILAVFAFTGMETGLCASGEVMNPGRTIPRALGLGLATITLLYVSIQMVAQGILGAALAQSTVPLADAMARISPALRVLMLVGASVSMVGYLTADLMGTPRVLFAFARDGLLPGALGRLHSRSKAPHIAIICYALIAMGLAVSGTFAELAVLATLTSAALYVLICAAAWRLAHRGVAESGQPLNFKWLPTAAVVGIGSMLGAIALASQEEILGLLALIAVCVVMYWLQTRVAVAQN
jgi:basic amino acid/polyamine antiporter, APA family